METKLQEIIDQILNHKGTALILTPTDDRKEIKTIETIKIQSVKAIQVSRNNYEFTFTIVEQSTKEGKEFVITYSGPPKDLKVVSKKILSYEHPLTILGEDKKLYLLLTEEKIE